MTGEIMLQGRLHGIAAPVNELLQRLANQAAPERRGPGRRARSWPCCTLLGPRTIRVFSEDGRQGSGISLGPAN